MAYLHWQDFLDADAISLLRIAVVEQQHRFVENTVAAGKTRRYDPNFRRSKVWYCDDPPLYDRFAQRLLAIADLNQTFGLPANPKVELEITGTGDGEYFKRHNDNGCPVTSHHIVTYVYYFTLTDEQRFSGGELILETDQGTITVVPAHNSLIMFPSSWWHEVLPVSLPSGEWRDARFTINGWLS